MRPPRISQAGWWWCGQCQQWWPGGWFAGWVDDGDWKGEHALELAPDDIDARPYTLRYCAECGNQLEPRSRPMYRTEDG